MNQQTLSVLLAGANASLPVSSRLTVSASIPAAVISMDILKLFREANILENNIVQTAASTDESIAAFPVEEQLVYPDGTIRGRPNHKIGVMLFFSTHNIGK